MAFVLVQVETCRACAGWGLLRADRLCFPCWSWSQRIRRHVGRCRRCCAVLVVNNDEMCRLCVLEVRYHDEPWLRAWYEKRDLPRRGHQLSLVLENIRLAAAQPLSKQRTPRVSWWQERHRPSPARPDDGSVLSAQISGQFALFRIPRTLTEAHAALVEERDVPELAAVIEVIDRQRARRGRSDTWRLRTIAVVRLALLAREADEGFVREEDLDQLPRNAALVADILAEAGLLRPRPPGQALGPRLEGAAAYRRPTKAVPPRSAGQRCAHCLAWMGSLGSAPLCEGCRQFARRGAAPAACARCARVLPLRCGLCRFCHIVLRHQPDSGQGEQLWLGGALALSVRWLWPPGDPRRAEAIATDARRAARADPTDAVSDHLINPAQLVLFEAPPRDWRPLLGRRLPALTEQAAQLLAAFEHLAGEQSWDKPVRNANRRVLRMIVSWLGAGAPLLEIDVRAIAVLRGNFSGLRVAQFLDARGLLVADPAKQITMDEAATWRLAATVAARFRPEIDAWIRVLRAQGSRPSRQLPWTTVRRYVGYLLPVLHRWHEAGIDSLRQITTGDIETALAARPHPSNHSALAALRSLFRALRRERLVFRDPARPVTLAKIVTLPRPLPADRLRGLIERAPTPLAAAAIALIAIHAVRHTELLRLHLQDLDRAAGRLTVRRPATSTRPSSIRTVVLEEVTLRLLGAWLQERYRLWPRSGNPHLFVTRRTAMNTDAPAMNKFTLIMQLRKVGVTPHQLWTDRLLDEAAETADPIRLMRLFDISQVTAIKYVATAHPQRFGIDPTQA